MAKLVPRLRSSRAVILPDEALTFNFSAALAGRVSSRHTHRAYFRWVDTFLVDLGGLKPSHGQSREARMAALPVQLLNDVLTAQQVRAWLGMLVGRGQGKQALGQARAALVTLADLLVEAEWLPEDVPLKLARVHPPRAEDGQRPGRWLSVEQIRALMIAAREIGTTETQAMRNHLAVTVLCTMALRREELSAARWGDLSIQNNRAVLQIHGKGRKVATIDIPRPVMRALDQWRRLVAQSDAPPRPDSALLRRIWKGGRIARGGVSADGIWWMVDEAARYAHIGNVAPHDLRRSVAGALHESGVPMEKISRLLRHSNIMVTERYINRLPHANEGAILMSDVLGLGQDQDDWPGFDE